MASYPWSGRTDALPEEVQQVLVKQGADQAEVSVLDVRTLPEYLAYHIPGARNIPVEALPNQTPDLDPDATWIVVCEHGVRSRAAQQFLVERGFEDVINMLGGMSRYTGEVETGMPR